MANIKDNKKGFKVIQISRKELVEELGHHEKRYTVYEIAARFLRMKGYNVRIEIGDNTENPSYCFGYIRFYRYVAISFN